MWHPSDLMISLTAGEGVWHPGCLMDDPDGCHTSSEDMWHPSGLMITFTAGEGVWHPSF